MLAGDRRRSPCCVAIYAATTVRDPMAKRVKALNERREQLKAGIIASTSSAAQASPTSNEMADKVRGLLSSLKVLQDEPGQEGAGQADAGRHPLQGTRRRRHLRPAGAADRVRRHRRSSCVYVHRHFPTGARSSATASSPATLHPELQGAGPLAEEQDHQAHRRDPQGPARRARPARDLRRGGPHRRRRLRPRRRASWARPIPSWATNSR